MTDYSRIDPEEYEGRLAQPSQRYQFDHWRARLLPRFKEHCAGKLVLDLGCGYGRWTREMKDARSVVGVDLSLPWLKHARARGSPALLQADAHRLPFRDGSFETVVSIGLLEYVRREVVSGEVARVLRPDGVCIVLAPNRRSLLRWPLRLAALLRGREHFCDEPTWWEVVETFSARGLRLVEGVRDDGLVWLPERIDRLAGPAVYRAIESFFRPFGANPFSAVMLMVFRNSSGPR